MYSRLEQVDIKQKVKERAINENFVGVTLEQ